MFIWDTKKSRENDMLKNETLKKIIKDCEPYRGFIGLSLLMALITVAASLIIPIWIGNAVDLIIGKGAVDTKALMSVLIRILIAVGVAGLSQLVMNLSNQKIVLGFELDLRTKLFKHLQSLPVSFQYHHSSGDTVSRMIADTEHITEGLLMGFTQLFTGVLTILGTLVFMVIVNVWLAIVVFVLTPVSLLVAKFIADKTHVHFQNQAKSRGEECAYANEIIANEKTVRAYGQEKRVMHEFGRYNETLKKHSMKAIFFSSLVNPSTRFVNALIYAIVGVVGAIIIVNTKGIALTIGSLTSFLTYAGQYAKPFNEISGVVAELKNSIVCAERVYELLEEETETEPQTPIFIRETKGHVEFKNVSFSYTKEQPLIQSFNLDVQPGEHIAIVGRTGAGKTTLINLLMRFYETSGGDILIDGQPIKEMHRDEVRSKFGMVLQETWIKGGTVYENIRIGRPDATDLQVREAAKQAKADSFIRHLKDGYNTVLPENGDGLSEG